LKLSQTKCANPNCDGKFHIFYVGGDTQSLEAPKLHVSRCPYNKQHLILVVHVGTKTTIRRESEGTLTLEMVPSGY